MNLCILILALALLLPVVAVRLVTIAHTRLGWIPYLANVLSEFFVKKVRWSRVAVDMALTVAGLVALRLAGLDWGWPLLAGLALVGLELDVRRRERCLLVTNYSPLDQIGLGQKAAVAMRGFVQGYPSPLAHPQLTINLVGPFTERVPAYRLGTLLVGREYDLVLVIGNHTIVPTQTGIRVRVTAPTVLACDRDFAEIVPRLESGGVHELRQRWTVNHAAGAGTLHFVVEWGHFTHSLEVGFDCCISPEAVEIAETSITRYPGACRSAFAWRGDMDLYDESTLQCIEGLEVTFGLAARYRIPQTMYLSTRLSLDQRAAEEWAAHYGVDRGAARIPAFVEWVQANVDLHHTCGYPYRSDKPFVIELGNHGHLHYGTQASGAPENQWKLKARMGAGVYRWLGDDHSSFGEQRDNATEARRWMERLFDFTPRSWAMPDRTNDRHTAAAMEAAGCEVLSGSNTTPRSNVLKHPPPHHPRGTQAVELTNRYPGDPQHIYHWAMVTFWLHRAHRRGIPMVFMCHQHMRQFDGHACSRFTENILRQALHQFNGDLHINTMFGVGKYWREVLSPNTARVRVSVVGNHVVVENRSDQGFERVPVDIRYAAAAEAQCGPDAHATTSTAVCGAGVSPAAACNPDVGTTTTTELSTNSAGVLQASSLPRHPPKTSTPQPGPLKHSDRVVLQASRLLHCTLLFDTPAGTRRTFDAVTGRLVSDETV